MAAKSIEIGIWLLERTETAGPDEWAKCVVAAATETEARQLANEESKAEGYVWTNGSLASVRKIGVADEGIQGVVLSAAE